MIRLRTPIAEDVQMLFEFHSNPELAEYFRRCPPLVEWGNPAQALQMFSQSLMIEEDGKVVGLALMGGFDFASKSAEIGMAIDPALCSNRGRVSLEAYRQMCDYLFDYLGYEKLFVKILSHRTKLIERFQNGGWAKEGLLKANCIFQGQRQDEVLLALHKASYKN